MRTYSLTWHIKWIITIKCKITFYHFIISRPYIISHLLILTLRFWLLCDEFCILSIYVYNVTQLLWWSGTCSDLQTPFVEKYLTAYKNDMTATAVKRDNNASQNMLYCQRFVRRVMLCVRHVMLCIRHVMLCVTHVMLCVRHVMLCVRHVMLCIRHVMLCIRHVMLCIRHVMLFTIRNGELRSLYTYIHTIIMPAYNISNYWTTLNCNVIK